jgi:biotin operon repressor
VNPLSEKNTANKVAAKITVDLSAVRERIRQLKENGASIEDVHALSQELGSLIKIKSSEVLHGLHNSGI